MFDWELILSFSCGLHIDCQALAEESEYSEDEEEFRKRSVPWADQRHQGSKTISRRVLFFFLETQTTRKKWMFPQTAISYVKDHICICMPLDISTTKSMMIPSQSKLFVYK